jgi:hypothetical protein
MRSELVERFLRHFELPYAHDDDDRSPAASGRAWQEAAAALGVPCPPALVELGDVQAEGRIWFGGSWELLVPSGVESRLAFVRKMTQDAPCLWPFTRMLPLLSGDGDLLLLGPDGALRVLALTSGDLFETHGVFAESLDVLLDAVTRGIAPPFDSYLPSGPTRPPDDVLWVDDLEYQFGFEHWHNNPGGVPTCISTLWIDLARHYFRYPDGPGSKPLTGHVRRACARIDVNFTGAPTIIPRVVPDRILLVGDERIDLRAHGEQFVRSALARGWTGRDGRSIVLDGWAELGLVAPERIVIL